MRSCLIRHGLDLRFDASSDSLRVVCHSTLAAAADCCACIPTHSSLGLCMFAPNTSKVRTSASFPHGKT